MDWMQQYLDYAETEAGARAINVILATLAAIGVFLLWAFGVLQKVGNFLFSKREPKAETGSDALDTPAAQDGPALTATEFIRLRRELKADLEQDLAEASAAEKEHLLARIAELKRQIASPEEALAEAQQRIAELETLLERMGNEIAGDRIAEARAALEQGDFSVADEIFAEVEARNELAVQETARAAFGRGEVAEAEVRWHDA